MPRNSACNGRAVGLSAQGGRKLSFEEEEPGSSLELRSIVVGEGLECLA